GGYAQQQVFGGDEVIAHPLGLCLGRFDDVEPCGGELGGGDGVAAGGGQRTDGRRGAGGDSVGLCADGFEQRDGDRLALIHQRLEKVRGLDLRVAGGVGVHGGRRYGLLGF